jgi:hypothetical protein
MERRLIALTLVGAGVWVQWGPGFGLIVLGVLFGLSGVPVRGLVAADVGAAARRAWVRTRGVVSAMPRRTAAAVLVLLAAFTLSWGMWLEVGLWAALVAFAAVAAITGTALGWESG